MTPNLTRVEVNYEGMVQGVGFRYTAVRIAENMAITGYVYNEYDGSVTIVAEGEKSILEDFLNQIRSSILGRYIIKEHISWREPKNEYNSFTIKF